MKKIDTHTSFAGHQEVWEHTSTTLHCTMRFGIYLPPQAKERRCPVVYWLSGLTCTEQNFITKAGAQQHAAKHGLILVTPDTSPRGDDVADDDAYDLGQGAGFYLNATQPPWATHYRMHDYIAHELPALIEDAFPATDARAISGHSMGGHGALVLALKHPTRYRSVSAFSPIVAPTRVPWGEKAFTAYLGHEREAWKEWDACELVAQVTEQLPLLVDQGENDNFLVEQLRPELLREACEKADYPLELRLHPGYDHSYYFVASFIADHISHHAKFLG